jgi:hypothetical protein
MSMTSDHLYDLLPVVYRMRDAERGYPLRALLGVIAEQASLVEADIAQLYENWFIETCQDWVVPYIGDLIGYQLVHEAGEPRDLSTPGALAHNKILIPRRDVADTIRNRRRKGALALLEELAADVAGWPSRAVEFYRLLGWTQNINHLHLSRARTADLRDGDALDRLGSPFDALAHTVDVRRINAQHTQGRYNIPSVGLFVWRLKVYSVSQTPSRRKRSTGVVSTSQTPAHCLEEVGPYCYTFSVLGNDTPLYVRPLPEDEPTHIADELNLPTPIRRRDFEANRLDYYGEGKSLAIWADWADLDPSKPIPVERIIAADLSDWEAYRPLRDTVAVDPVLGRIVFPSSQLPKRVRVAYHYAFSADMGGGEYERQLSQPGQCELFTVSGQEQLKKNLEPWDALSPTADLQKIQPAQAVIEIADSGVYVLPINLKLLEGHSLQIRAASGKRPIIRLLDWQTDQPDALTVTMASGSRITLDGLLITGRAVHIRGNEMKPAHGNVCPAEVNIRHCTLVPGWALRSPCGPKRPAEPSLELFNVRARVCIEHSIVGSIQVKEDPVKTDPIPVHITDSILDATRSEREALGAPGYEVAHVVLTIKRCTVFGIVDVHAIELAENCIFNDCLNVARRQLGCMRFCYVPHGCRTPRRYNCQPDLVDKPILDSWAQSKITAQEKERRLASERRRVRPQFTDRRYGQSGYGQLAEMCADEIKRGADDQSEMGAYHDLFQPQREANLRARLDEYTPAGMDVGIIFVS